MVSSLWQIAKQPVLAAQYTNFTVTKVKVWWQGMLVEFAAWTEGMVSAKIAIIKVIYKMVPHVIFQFCFDGDDWKVNVNNTKGIPQTWKMMEIRVPVWVTGVRWCL